MNDTTIYDRDGGDWRARGNKLGALERLNPWRFRYFDRFVPRWEGLQVLDIGCGAGFTAEYLAKRGAPVSGVDPAEAVIRMAQQHASTLGLSIHYRTGTAEHLPYLSESFDVAVCVDVLEHVSDVAQSLREAARVLKPRGYLLFDTINRTTLARVVMVWLLEDVLGIIPQGAHDWRMFIPPMQLERGLADAGFDRVQLAGFPLKSVMYIGAAQKRIA